MKSHGGAIFAVAQRENVDEPTPEQLYTMGVIARIGQVQRGLGGVQLLLQGETPGQRPALPSRTRATSRPRSCRSRRCSRSTRTTRPSPPCTARLRERAMELGEARGLPEEVLHQVLDTVTEPGRFADLVAGYVELPAAEKQRCWRRSASRSGCGGS